MKKILVTGSTGFIGQYVIKELLKQPEVEIIATGRSIEKARSLDWFDQVKFIPYELSQKQDQIYSFFGQPDLLIHLAWQGLPYYKELYHIEQNLWDNYHFIKQMTEQGLKQVVVTGTCFEYGKQSGCLSEEQSTLPNNPYALAKDSLRKFLEILNVKNSFIFQWVRLFYMYGKGQNPRSLFGQLEKAIADGDPVFPMSGGEQLRDYLHIEELARYLVKIGLQNEVCGIINCCSGQPISVRKLVEQYLEDKKVAIQLDLGYYSYPEHEPMAFWGNNTKLEMITGQTKA